MRHKYFLLLRLENIFNSAAGGINFLFYESVTLGGSGLGIHYYGPHSTEHT